MIRFLSSSVLDIWSLTRILSSTGSTWYFPCSKTPSSPFSYPLKVGLLGFYALKKFPLVIGELRGLQKKKSASPSNQDEEHAKQVSEAAVRSLQVLESIKRDNLKLLVRGGRTLKMDINYKYFSAEIKTVSVPISVMHALCFQNNDRLIIESAKEFSEKVCPKGIRLPRGDLWVFREVCLLTRDRIMMLLANAYRLPSLDCDSFADWAGFQCKEQC